MERPSPRIIVLGNQKSGTTAIATLLAEMCGLSTCIDLPRSARFMAHRIAKGQLDFDTLITRHARHFQKELVKEPILTFLAADVYCKFPRSRFVFVVRDPRSNIRSLLNRRKLPGNLKQLPLTTRLKLRVLRRPIFDRQLWGEAGGGYIEVLANRWNRALSAMDDIEAPIVVRYEDFLDNKLAELQRIAQDLDLTPSQDITDRLDVAFQPRGDRDVDLREFFGSENIRAIERCCATGMAQFGYAASANEPTQGSNAQQQ